MNINILDIFYKNIVPEATTGRIDCNCYYNMIFSTRIMENNTFYCAKTDNDSLLVPTLVIKNKKLFDELLIEYVSLAMKFYDSFSYDFDILNYKMYTEEKRICQEKVILSFLFANATIEDFNNPCDYLRKRINFLKNDITCGHSLGYSNMLKGNLIIEIDKDIINNETPYQMIIRVLSDDGEIFELPRIKLGISDDVVYIYAIQNKPMVNSTYSKKINRTLYKVGEGYNDEYDIEQENLKDVTSSFLVALNVGISYLHNCGYVKIIVPSYLIERWNAKSIANSLKIKYKNMDEKEAVEIFNKQDSLQQNLTNKLVRTFLRLGCHYNNIDIDSFPYEVDSCLHISINDNDVKCNNALLYETYMLGQRGERGKHK